MNTDQTREALVKMAEPADHEHEADIRAALTEHEAAIRAEAAREAAKEALNGATIDRLAKYWAERSLIADKDAVENALTEAGDMIADRAARIGEGKA